MSRKSTSIIALFACAFLAFAATGCGSKKNSSATTTTTATTVAAAPVTTATETTSTDTTATDTSSTDTTSTDTSATGTTATATTSTTATDTTSTGTTSAPSVASLANCAQLRNLGEKFSQAFSGAGTGDLAKSAEIMQEFADQTPSDIRPDFEVIAKAYTQLASAMKGLNLKSGQVPNADQLAKLTQLSTQFDSAALTKAETDITAWAQKNCGTG